MHGAWQLQTAVIVKITTLLRGGLIVHTQAMSQQLQQGADKHARILTTKHTPVSSSEGTGAPKRLRQLAAQGTRMLAVGHKKTAPTHPSALPLPRPPSQKRSWQCRARLLANCNHAMTAALPACRKSRAAEATTDSQALWLAQMTASAVDTAHTQTASSLFSMWLRVRAHTQAAIGLQAYVIQPTWV